MENKTTSELLDLIGKYDVKIRNEKDVSDKETDEWVEAHKELKQRTPFSFFLDSEEEYFDETKPSLQARIVSLEENAEDFEKKMKRHKHDPLNGDVMIRI